MKIKSIRQLCSLIAKKEGLKKQVSIGNVREIVGIISDLVLKCSTVPLLLVTNGKKRAKKK